MQNARRIAILAAAAAALAACSNGQGNQDQNIIMDGNGAMDPNADIETLPADESSATPSSELQNGFVSDEEENGDTANAQ